MRAILAEACELGFNDVSGHSADALSADGLGKDDFAHRSRGPLLIDNDGEPDVVAVEVNADEAAVGFGAGSADSRLYGLSVSIVVWDVIGLDFSRLSIDHGVGNGGQFGIKVRDGIIHGDFVI